MRIFTALPVSSPVAVELTKQQRILENLNPDIPLNWVEPDNFHVTLQFLGECSAAQLATISSILAAVAASSRAFQFKTQGLGVFPNLAEPRVVLAKIADESYKAMELEALLNHQLAQAGFPVSDKPWQPHVTLGRIKPCSHFDPFVLPHEALGELEWTVGEVHLIKSELNSDGSHYTVLERFHLL